ncbi:uncharacterized protein LOC133307580 [Gastrolobium bilobum]|uniref:uncharacterized protein LOC133307580 n=1 Tax=Gastrolobium bilobum TaxID=150636 RepID=UPI002AB0F2ED|nr:uncharacterized protein LOC133307580 [Gastrolobium bilobum]
MSILHNSSNNNNNSSTQVQVWNNAAFDGFEHYTLKSSWSSSSDCTKENLSPAALNSSPKPNKGFGSEQKRDAKEIDDEIENIENEIKRLSKRLEGLRLEKVERIAFEKRGGGGRVVAAKFMEPKPKQNAVVWAKKVEETPKSKVVNSRRGVSLGPAEIVSRVAPLPGKADFTPLTGRRKSCFWKLEDKSVIHSVGGSRKCVKKKEDWVEPKKLMFKEGEKSVSVSSNKKGRVVASRYNKSSEARKRSLPESNNGNEVVKVKKRWEIPSEAVNGVVLLPKIRTLQRGGNDDNESSRDSGPAKRVAELIGKRSYFCPDENAEGSVCQVLSFAEEEEG